MNINQTQNVNAKISENDIRIMSHNIFLYDNPPISERLVFFMKELEIVAPDIICLQETSEKWHELLSVEMPKHSFAYVPLTNANYEGAEQRYNYNVVMYNTELFELTDHFHIRYSTYDPEKPNLARVFTCGILTRKNDGKKMACMSTHFTAGAKVTEHFRVTEATEILAGLDIIKEKHGNIPTVLTGDLNALYNTPPLRKLGEKMICVRDIEGMVKHNTDIGTTNYHWGELPTKEHPIIDFAFITGEGYTAKQYQHIVNEISATASDHIAIAFDLEI